MRESIHDASAANFVQKHSLEALEKTNEEYAAKLKFLLKKIEAYEQQSSSTDDRTTKRVRPAFLPETMRDRNRPNSIHDIIETNRYSISMDKDAKNMNQGAEKRELSAQIRLGGIEESSYDATSVIIRSGYRNHA